MKYVKIFFLHFQDAINDRSRSVVWFLISLINPVVYLLFWKGATENSTQSIQQWTMTSFASYYLLLVIAGAFLMVHIEEYIAWYDVKEGYLANHLLRPVSYFWQNLFHELPYRLLQGSFGLIVLFLFFLKYPELVQLVQNREQILLALLIVLFAHFLSFCLKMLLGISALFTTDFYGLSEFVGVVILVFGGFVIPLDLFPEQLKQVAFLSPFPYMFYYPILSIAGRLESYELMRVVAIQFVWICILVGCYKFVWKQGIQLFTGVGR